MFGDIDIKTGLQWIIGLLAGLCAVAALVVYAMGKLQNAQGGGGAVNEGALMGLIAAAAALSVAWVWVGTMSFTYTGATS